MKYLKTFERYEQEDLGEQIAHDLLPRFQKMRSNGEIFTLSDFDKYMQERGAGSELSDSVMHHLVNMGFDFDIDEEDYYSDDIDFEIKTKY